MRVERRIEQLVGLQLVLELPENFENHRVEVIVLTLDDDKRLSAGRILRSQGR